MDKTAIIVNLSPKLQNFLRFYYKWQKPFFEFPESHSINSWISDNLQEIPENVNLNFGVNTFKIEVPLLFSQDSSKRYYVNQPFTVMFQHRMTTLLKDYYNQRFEEAVAEKFGIDFCVINIMNELNIINIKTITELQGINIYSSDSFVAIKECILKNNKTEFEAISKRYTRWRKKEYVRNWREKNPKKVKRNFTKKSPAA